MSIISAIAEGMNGLLCVPLVAPGTSHTDGSEDDQIKVCANFEMVRLDQATTRTSVVNAELNCHNEIGAPSFDEREPRAENPFTNTMASFLSSVLLRGFRRSLQ